MASQATRSNTSSAVTWTSSQAYTMAVLCLVIGVGVGWFLRGSQSPATPPAGSTTTTSQTSGGMNPANPFGNQPSASPQDLKRMADAQAAPLLARLSSNPNDAGALTELGNIYFDTKQYKDAIDYYSRVLKLQPTNTNVRTDMGIAYWEGMRDADRAIAEFNTALKYEPTKPQTLQSMGIVKWQGKSDVKGAVAAWQKLLETNPTYEKRADIQQLITQARQQ